MQRKMLSALIFSLGFTSSPSILYAATGLSMNNHTVRKHLSGLESRFEVTLTALALKPSATNLNYVIYNKALPLQSPTWYEQELRPAYSFAFGLGARYLFSEGKDVSLDWTHLNSSTSSSVAAPNDDYFLGPDYEIGPDAIPIRNATGKVVFKYDVINLNVGQSLGLNEHVGLRFFGGLSNGISASRWMRFIPAM